MKPIFFFLGIAVILALLTLLITYICFRIVFYAPRKQEPTIDAIPLPEGEIYEPYHPLMKKWILEARSFPQEDHYITSLD